ncbi:MAG: carboxypeptidase regulatory-like domain-containing protein, partial [Proteobacteria bacterium]|nr:carboxypeptidase regulatory-like domain-containing protein [Pseudomonadota bacterium]
RDRFGFHLEATYAYNLLLDNTSYNPETRQEQLHRTTPLELSLTTRARPKENWWLAFGLGGGIGPDTIGQSNLRVQGGFGFSFKPSSGTVIEPDEPEKQQYLTFVVVDPQGEPIEGASLIRGSHLLGESDSVGEFRLPVPVRFGSGILVDHPAYLSEKVSRSNDEDLNVKVSLMWQPVGLTVSVRDKHGEVLPAQVDIDGSQEVPAAMAQEDGTLRGALLPGEWTLLISADGYGEQIRHINVPPRGTADVEVESILIEEQGAAELALSFVDSEGAPIEGVRILLDGIPLGSAKALGLDSLASGVHELSISAHGYRPVEQKLDLGDEKTVLDIRMRDADGALKVRVVDADGVAVHDAHVGFLKGTERYPPVGLGTTGERRFQLTPGAWKVLVTSSVFGMQERDVVLEENSAAVELVEIRFQPDEGGEAQLIVNVKDTDNNPLVGAEVFLDDKPLGKTSSGGSLVVYALDVGPRLVRVEGEHFRPMEPLEKFVVVGPNLANISLEWKTGICQVEVTGPDGPIDDVVLRAYGPETIKPVELGPSGTGIIELGPGQWEVL